jgi:hypothetical protein
MPTATSDRRPFYRSRWWMPLFSVSIGLVFLAAFAIGGDVVGGLWSLGVMTAVGGLFLFGSRSETLRGLAGPGRDERWAMIDIHATALAGMVTIAVVLGAFAYEIANGRDGSPYGQIGAIAGLAYIVAVAVLRRRS